MERLFIGQNRVHRGRERAGCKQRKRERIEKEGEELLPGNSKKKEKRRERSIEREKTKRRKDEKGIFYGHEYAAFVCNCTQVIFFLS